MILSEDDLLSFCQLESEEYGIIDIYKKGSLYYYIGNIKFIEENLAFFSKTLYVDINYIKKCKKIQIKISPF